MAISEASFRQTPLDRTAVLIPALNPDERLVELAEALSRLPFAVIVIVNDGSDMGHDAIFQRVSLLPKAIVLRHDRNRGTGRATRTAMGYVLEKLPGVTGVVTADADGQHKVEDIVRVGEALSRSTGWPVMGSRALDAGVPLRSRFGNMITHHVFRLLSGVNVHDTQCGLRGIPRQWISEALRVKGDRYDFVLGLLAYFCRRGAPPKEVSIDTIYIEGNRSSHFKPVRDSVRIYWFLLRGYLPSFLPACIDFAGFLLVYALSDSIAAAVLVGRIAAVAAIALHKLFARVPGQRIAKPIAVLAVTGLLSFAGIWILAQRLHWNAVIAKLVVEFALWIALDWAGLRRPAQWRPATNSPAIHY